MSDERLRLLFVEDGRGERGDSRGGSLSRGTARVFSRWPAYLGSALFTVIVLVGLLLLALLGLLCLLYLTGNFRLHDPGELLSKQLANTQETETTAQDIRSEFCDQMHSKLEREMQGIPEKDLEVFDSRNNIFYVISKPLDKFSSCAIESVARLCPDKNIFLMMISEEEHSGFFRLLKEFLKFLDKTDEKPRERELYDYEFNLGTKYDNVNVLRLNGERLLKGSPFEGKKDRLALDISLLTVWQFGGTVLSQGVVMLDPSPLLSSREHPEGCKVDGDLLQCPIQCAAYAYDLISSGLKHKRASLSHLLEDSLRSFCGSGRGCPGAARLAEERSCDEPRDGCWLLRSQGLRARRGDDSAAWAEIAGHCPVTASLSPPGQPHAKPRRQASSKGVQPLAQIDSQISFFMVKE